MFTKFENKFDLDTQIAMLHSLILVVFSFFIAVIAVGTVGYNPSFVYLATIVLYLIFTFLAANKTTKTKRANKIYKEKERQEKIAEAKEKDEEVILRFEDDFYDGEKTFMVVRHINKDGLERVEMVEMPEM